MNETTWRSGLTAALLSALLLTLAGPATLPAQVAAKSTAETDDSVPAVRKTGPSGLPLPRFVSLKSDRINVRAGPGQDHRIAWIFAKAGLPVEIVAEYDNWRRIRDSEGEEGWVFHSLLSGRRTALVAPWATGKTVGMRRQPSKEGALAAKVEPYVLVDVSECDGAWCRVSVEDVSGWIQQDMLWGVYPKEALD